MASLSTPQSQSRNCFFSPLISTGLHPIPSLGLGTSLRGRWISPYSAIRGRPNDPSERVNLTKRAQCLHLATSSSTNVEKCANQSFRFQPVELLISSGAGGCAAEQLQHLSLALFNLHMALRPPRQRLPSDGFCERALQPSVPFCAAAHQGRASEKALASSRHNRSRGKPL